MHYYTVRHRKAVESCRDFADFQPRKIYNSTAPPPSFCLTYKHHIYYRRKEISKGRAVSFVTIRPFSLWNNLICRRCGNRANYSNIKVTWQKYHGESKNNLFSLMSKKCGLYEIESILKSLVNSNLDLNSQRKKYLYAEQLPANDLQGSYGRVVTNVFHTCLSV